MFPNVPAHMCLTPTATSAWRSEKPSTSPDEIEHLLARLKSRAPQWAALDSEGRIHYLRACLDQLPAAAPDWVSAAAGLKGGGDRVEILGEEWIAGPTPVARNIGQLIEALESEAQPPPVALTTRRSGQRVATIFPASLRERVMFPGFTGDVWIEPGRAPSQGRFYREPGSGGVLTVVLGAGNVTSIPLMDALYNCAVEGSVVVLTMHPLLTSLGDAFARAFQALADAGFFAIVYGDAETGAALVTHPLVDAIHITGSAETYDRIVWGSDPRERDARKANRTPANSRTITSELGCVTPIIVTPGEWSSDELAFQARHIASMLVHNASHNCTAAQVLITSSGWSQRRELLEVLQAMLSELRPRVPFYPGSRRRYDEFVARYAPSWTAESQSDRDVPWTMVEGVSPAGDPFAFQHELFCGALIEVPLETDTADAFLDAAVRFANEKCWGTLSEVVIIDGVTRGVLSHGVDRAIESLRYGAIGINLWTGVMFGLVSPPWGAFPGSDPADIQSGSGVVHNTFLFDHPQKSVFSAPFTMSPTPAWFPDHQNLLALGVALFQHEVHPTLARLVRVGWAALRG